MADENTTQDPAQEPAAPVEEKAETPPWGDDFDPARAWKTIQKLRARENELAPLAQRARELEESQKSEAQRLIEERDAIKAERDAMKLEALRLRIASEKGLTPKQAARLRGATEEEMSADADELLAEFGSTGPRRPVGDIDQGARGSTREPSDPKSLADAVQARRGY